MPRRAFAQRTLPHSIRASRVKNPRLFHSNPNLQRAAHNRSRLPLRGRGGDFSAAWSPASAPGLTFEFLMAFLLLPHGLEHEGDAVRGFDLPHLAPIRGCGNK